jgi:hypothetical protein
MKITSRKIGGKSFRKVSHNDHERSLRMSSYLADRTEFYLDVKIADRDYELAMSREEVTDLRDSLSRALKKEKAS